MDSQLTTNITKRTYLRWAQTRRVISTQGLVIFRYGSVLGAHGNLNLRRCAAEGNLGSPRQLKGDNFIIHELES
jgi:hypothetical protein